ncbi:MAG: arylesterase [Boseongicola sp.]|nr:arylesterase [Boseongicola sp.]
MVSVIFSWFRFCRPFTPYGMIRTIRNVGLLMFLSVNAALAQQVTIAALGDSLTQGYGLPLDDGFVPQLEDWLNERGAEVTIINAGVSGDTTAGGLSRIEWTLTPEIDALIVALGGNDLLRGIDPELSRSNIEGILKVTSNRELPVLLVGMDAPSNYGAEFETAFDAIYPELSETYGTLLYPNFLGALAKQDDRKAALLEYMQPDGIHPNSEGVSLIVGSIGPHVMELVNLVRD